MKKQAKSLGFILVILLLAVMLIAISSPMKVSALSYSHENVMPAVSENTAPIAETFQGYLFLVLQGKTGNTWKVRVYGPNPKMSYNFVFQYSSYMCFLDDAKGWKNLNSQHIKTVTTGIPGFQGVDVYITENFFADAIAVSYICADGNRYITYANLLNRFDNSLVQDGTYVKA